MRMPVSSENTRLLQFNSRVNKLSHTAEAVEKNSASDQELRKTTQEFESLFLHTLMKTMRTTVPKNSPFHGGLSEEIYTDMLDQEIAKAASKRGTGIANLLYQQLRRTLK